MAGYLQVVHGYGFDGGPFYDLMNTSELYDKRNFLGMIELSLKKI